MFKISTLQNFSYFEENIDKGAQIREKSILITDLLTHPERLEEEREQARLYREKFYPRSSHASYGGGSMSASPGGASYGGY